MNSSVGEWSALKIVLTAFAVGFVVGYVLHWSRPQKRKKRWLWRYLTNDGYVRRISFTGRIGYEHRMVAEEVLRRKLKKGEVVHHINGQRADNRPENLCVMPSDEHERYHGWYDWVVANFGKYPRRETQLKKLRDEFKGTLLEDYLKSEDRAG